MVVEQRHPYLWVWPLGGIHSNPGCDEQDVAEYEARVWRNAKERKVRLFGGFLSLVGDPVFQEEDLAYLKAQRKSLPSGTHGRLELA
jgi:hypothetical protein